MRKPVIYRLVTTLQAEMSRAGGRLSSLSSEQNWVRLRNNSSEGKNIPSHQEGAFMPSSAAKSETEVTEKTTTEKTSVPPAGGTAEARVGREVIDFLRGAGYVVDENKKPRGWTDKFLDEAIPAAVTVGAALTFYAGFTLIRTRLGDPKPKTLMEVAPVHQMEATSSSSNSRKAS